MNRALELIYQRYPIIEQAMDHPPFSLDMTDEELVFYQLSLFFLNPNRHDFLMSSVQRDLEDEGLEFFLSTLKTFYVSDTDKMYNANNLLRSDVEELDSNMYFKGSTFVKRIQEEIPNTTFVQTMFWSYLSTKTAIPQPDLIIDSVKFWKDSTINKFIEEEKETPKRKKRNK